MIQHDEIFSRMRSLHGFGYIHWLLLTDVIIECDLKIHCLDRGSLDPIVGAIREQLEANSWMTLDELTEAVGGVGEFGRRVVAEVLAVMERDKEVLCEVDAQGFFRFDANITKWKNRYVREHFVENRFFFVPRSKEFATRIRGKTKSSIEDIMSDEGLPWWEPPDENDIYVPENLDQELKLACKEYCRINDFITPKSDIGEARLEALQRSQLSFVKLKPVDALVVRRRRTKLWRLHKCYLFNSNEYGTGRCKTEVYHYPEGPLQIEYTDYLKMIIENELVKFVDLWNIAEIPTSRANNRLA